jgi:hypothetical protein
VRAATGLVSAPFDWDELADIQMAEFTMATMLRFELNRRIGDAEWRPAGLTLLDSSDTHAAVVFAARSDLDRFRRRLAEYAVALDSDLSKSSPPKGKTTSSQRCTKRSSMPLTASNRSNLRIGSASASSRCSTVTRLQSTSST